MKHPFRLWPCLLLALLCTAQAATLRAQSAWRHNAGHIFGTTYHITYEYGRDLGDSILAELHKVDNSLSMFNAASTISKINRNEPVRPDTMFMSVFRLSQEVSAATGGAFDITVSPLVNLWGFGFKKQGEATRARVDSLLPLVDYRKVRYSGGRIVKADPRMMLDCSAVAKGYGSDCVARLFDRCGIRNYLVEIGGEIVAKGRNSTGGLWRIGVETPRDSHEETNDRPAAVLTLTGMGMATSGNYRNYYYKGRRKYAHTIDPHTGRPVRHTLLSSTVIAADCATADAYATAFMVLGLRKAKTLLARHPELQAYFIYSDKKGKNAVWCSPRLKSMIRP